MILNVTDAGNPPKLFISYSHDSDSHKSWVLQLANRLTLDGVDVVLDQYQLSLGSDLPAFMESGLADADRVLAICTSEYVVRANGRRGGVGYESTILTADLMDNLGSTRIIPVIINNQNSAVVPSFLRTKLYIDFRDPQAYEARYDELLREIHGTKAIVRPPLGRNPFRNEARQDRPARISTQRSRYVSPALYGRVCFPYSNNSGDFVLGSNNLAFTTNWTEAGHGVIHFYQDRDDIRSIALAARVTNVAELGNASEYDNSSRCRTARVGDCAIFENTHGYYCAVFLEGVTTRSTSANEEPELTFSYAIQANRTADFSQLETTP